MNEKRTQCVDRGPHQSQFGRTESNEERYDGSRTEDDDRETVLHVAVAVDWREWLIHMRDGAHVHPRPCQHHRRRCQANERTTAGERKGAVEILRLFRERLPSIRDGDGNDKRRTRIRPVVGGEGACHRARIELAANPKRIHAPSGGNQREKQGNDQNPALRAGQSQIGWLPNRPEKAGTHQRDGCRAAEESRRYDVAHQPGDEPHYCQNDRTHDGNPDQIAAARRPSASKQPAHHQTRCDKEGDDSGQREAEGDSRRNAPAGRIDADQSQDENDEPDPLWRHRGCRVARSRCANRLGVRWRCLRYGPCAGQDLQLAGWCTWRRMRYFDRSATTAQGSDTFASASTFRAKIDCDAGRTLSRLPSERNVSGQTPLVVRPLVQRVAER